MDFNLFKNLDKAFDFESIERTVASGVQQGRKPEWEAICKELQLLQASESANPRRAVSAAQWQQRARDSEYKLIQICSLLLPLPDPVPFMQTLAGVSARVTELEEQNRTLKTAADSVAADAQEVTDLVAKHQKLESAHRELQELLLSQSAEMEQFSNWAGQAQAHNALAAEQAAEINRLQSVLRTLRNEHESGQSALFELSSRAELEGGSRAAESELTLELLDRATTRISDLEREIASRAAESAGERDALLARLGAAGEGGGAGSMLAGAGVVGGARAGSGRGRGAEEDAFWERQMALKAEQIAGLQAQVDFLAKASSESAGRHEMALQSASNQLAAADLTISRQGKELTKRPEAALCQELAGRLETLQQLVSGELESDGWTPGAIQGLLKQPTQLAVSGVLQERIRKLSGDISDLRRQLSDSSKSNAKAAADLESAVAKLAHKTQLITSLERDLSRTLITATHASTLASNPSSLQNSTQQNSQSGGGGADESGLQGGALTGSDGSHLVQGGASLAADVSGGGSSALLDIVVSQRERFRLRVTQLEEEAGTMSTELAASRRSVESARADNVVLYEKLRYLERYSQRAAAQDSGNGNHGSSKGQQQQAPKVVRVDEAGLLADGAAREKANRYQCGPLAFDFGGGSGAGAGKGGGGGAGARVAGVRSRATHGKGLIAGCFPEDQPDEENGGLGGGGASGPEERAARAYEARVNPFVEFQQSEVERRVKGLNLHDRAVLAGGRLMLGNRAARVFIAAYAALLHLFILMLLYYSLMSRRDSSMSYSPEAAEGAAAAAAAAGAAIATAVQAQAL